MWVKVGSLLLVGSLIFGGDLGVDSPKVITPKWEEKVFGIKYYEPTTLVNSLHEMIHGIPEEYFNEDFFNKLEAYLKNNTQNEGVYEEYWKNGQKKVRLPYKDGRAHGHLHGWYENGNHAFKGHFNEGVKQGTHITFFPVEKERNPMYSHILRYNMKGELDREQLKGHITEGLCLSAGYENGKINGPLVGWDKSGKYHISCMYKNGILQKEPPPSQRIRSMSRYRQRVDVKYVDEITNDIKKIAKREYGAYCTGAGGSMPKDIQKISVDLDIKKRVTIEEAREIFVSLTERFKDLINDHEKIRPYLREYPLPYNKARICLAFCDRKGRMFEDGSPNLIVLDKHNQICYLGDKPHLRDSYDIFKEPYEEALKKVQKKDR